MTFFPLQWSKYCERQNKMKKEHKCCARSFTLIATILLLQSPVTGKMFSDLWKRTTHWYNIWIEKKSHLCPFTQPWIHRFDKLFPPVKLLPHKLYLNWFHVFFNINYLGFSCNLVELNSTENNIFIMGVDEVKSTLLFNKINENLPQREFGHFHQIKMQKLAIKKIILHPYQNATCLCIIISNLFCSKISIYDVTL